MSSQADDTNWAVTNLPMPTSAMCGVPSAW